MTAVRQESPVKWTSRTLATVTTAMATRVDGMTLVIFGNTKITIRPRTINPTMAATAVSVLPRLLLKVVICDRRMMNANPSTNPTMMERGMRLSSAPIPSRPRASCMIPASSTAANMYSRPWLATSEATSTAMEPAPAETMAGLPPMKDRSSRNATEVYRPRTGSTPATMVNPMTSGMTAKAETIPAKKSPLGFPIHSDTSREREGSFSSAMLSRPAILRACIKLCARQIIL